MFTLITLVLGLSSVVNAWLPHERNLFGAQPDSIFVYFAAGKGRTIKRYLPSFNKIRAVNLGSLFVIEPWMVSKKWGDMGCGDMRSEFDCVKLLGQKAADVKFQEHWNTWITTSDMDKIKEYGINTIRVPVGYWMVESLVTSDEYFPRGGLKFLDRLVGWAADRGIYVIIDHHGAPRAQEVTQPFTGQWVTETGYYQTSEYERAYKFLQNMTERIHTNNAYRTTGMIQVLNEPERGHPTLVSSYYPNAYDKIRAIETKYGVTSDKLISIQFMDSAWGAGNAKPVLGDKPGVVYDSHRYLKWSTINHTKANYVSTSCADTFGENFNTPLMVGEWSISVKTELEWNSDFDPNVAANKIFYRQWWAAQVTAYEKQLGWAFWSWKTQLNDYRWGYKQAVEAGVIPKNPGEAAELAGC
ncbi:putative glucan endo-1,6-beta-glucosidase B [Dendryphion nanum]|uniref:glucan endo-1,6-beta-glucosidase n=1 Tax=Dendryphion nanum TaxID=256645 RepID=A0A9P9IG79_9PLEO|nr:putative glucan endo-1,6-beta-glucosidase B [Dendryphion nanum]